MYVELSDTFRKQYCELWLSMVLTDSKELERICAEWGVGDPELFATFQLLKPFQKPGSGNPNHLRTVTKEQVVAHFKEMREQGYERARKILSDSSKTPRELVVLGRAMNIVRANNAAMGSPANRVGILAGFAVDGYATSIRTTVAESSSFSHTVMPRILNQYATLVSLRLRLAMLSAGYYAVQCRRWCELTLNRGKAEGFEELLKERMAAEMKKLGLEINMEEDDTWENIQG